MMLSLIAPPQAKKRAAKGGGSMYGGFDGDQNENTEEDC